MVSPFFHLSGTRLFKQIFLTSPISYTNILTASHLFIHTQARELMVMKIHHYH